MAKKARILVWLVKRGVSLPGDSLKYYDAKPKYIRLVGEKPIQCILRRHVTTAHIDPVKHRCEEESNISYVDWESS